MILISSILLALLVLEEILHRLNRGSSFMDVDLAGDSVAHVEKSGSGRLNRILSGLRLLQLFLFAMLFALAAVSSGVRLVYTQAGQITGLLLLIQVVRIMNRKVINQWAVLGATVILQAFLLILLLLQGLSPEITSDPVTYQGRWMISLLSFVVFFNLSITIPFIGTYFLRLASREGTGLFYFLPSLAYSEYWIRRLTRVTANVALAALIIMTLLVVNYRFPTGEAMLHIVMMLLLLSSLSLFRNGLKLHHPLAVSLILAAWVLRMIWTLLGMSTMYSGWFG